MIPSGMLMICLAFELTSKMIRKYEEKTTTTKTTKQKSFNHALYAYWDNFSTLNTLSRNKTEILQIYSSTINISHVCMIIITPAFAKSQETIHIEKNLSTTLLTIF